MKLKQEFSIELNEIFNSKSTQIYPEFSSVYQQLQNTGEISQWIPK